MPSQPPTYCLSPDTESLLNTCRCPREGMPPNMAQSTSHLPAEPGWVCLILAKRSWDARGLPLEPVWGTLPAQQPPIRCDMRPGFGHIQSLQPWCCPKDRGGSPCILATAQLLCIRHLWPIPVLCHCLVFLLAVEHIPASAAL